VGAGFERGFAPGLLVGLGLKERENPLIEGLGGEGGSSIDGDILTWWIGGWS
jgi:hypothetical protein